MEVGRYVDGRDVTYDEATTQFAIAGVPVTLAEVLAYDESAQIEWANEETRQWARGLRQVIAPPTSRSEGEQLPSAFSPAQGGWFSRLPTWGKVLFVLFYPVSIPYAVWAMWRGNRFTQPVRIGLTVVAALFMVYFLSNVLTARPAAKVAQTPSATPTAVTAPPPAAAPAEPATPAPEPKLEPVAESKPAPAPAPPKPAKKVYKSLSAREFQKLAKDPDAYAGQAFTIYGEVIQFDAATGTDQFRANTGSKRLRVDEYGFVNFEQNSILRGSASRLANVVQGDVFCANVTVVGSYSYETQIGGNTTVPMFDIGSIAVYGSTAK